MRSGMTELAAQELADKLEASNDDEAVTIIGELIDWFGAPDWDGPTLPVDLGRRIADFMALDERGLLMLAQSRIVDLIEVAERDAGS